MWYLVMGAISTEYNGWTQYRTMSHATLESKTVDAEVCYVYEMFEYRGAGKMQNN